MNKDVNIYFSLTWMWKFYLPIFQALIVTKSIKDH